MAFEAFSNFFNDPDKVASFQVAAGTAGAAIGQDNPFAVAAGELAAESGKAFKQQQLLTTLEGEQGAAAEEELTPSALATPVVPQSGSLGTTGTPVVGANQGTAITTPSARSNLAQASQVAPLGAGSVPQIPDVGGVANRAPRGGVGGPPGTNTPEQKVEQGALSRIAQAIFGG